MSETHKSRVVTLNRVVENLTAHRADAHGGECPVFVAVGGVYVRVTLGGVSSDGTDHVTLHVCHAPPDPFADELARLREELAAVKLQRFRMRQALLRAGVDWPEPPAGSGAW